MPDRTLNDEAWEQLFERYNILERVESDGSFFISSAKIKEYREPRLMAKFDHRINLPQLFYDNDLAILPVSKRDYVIAHFDAYHSFEPFDGPVENASLPAHIQSLDSHAIPSEAIALNCANAAGILADFTEDEDMYATVSGRKGSGSFSFQIGDTVAGLPRWVNVNNAQIEVDAAYEGVSYLTLFEAKKDLSEDFLVRQLYYPFRVWGSSVTKPVKTVFLVYSNGIYRLFEYVFENPEDYSSLRLVKQRNYSIEDTAISAEDIQAVLAGTAVLDEPAIPFPQADSFERIVNLCELLNEQDLSRADVTENYDFDARQTNYYTDAARYLGLLDKRSSNEGPLYSVSEKGRQILELEFKPRQMAYCRCILSHKVFHDTLRLYLQSGVMPSTGEIVSIMKQSHLYQVNSDSTFERRASTVKGWLNWIVSIIND